MGIYYKILGRVKFNYKIVGGVELAVREFQVVEQTIHETIHVRAFKCMLKTRTRRAKVFLVDQPTMT